MQFKTSISKMTDDDHIIRGEKLSELIAGSSFSDAIFLLLRGQKPGPAESVVFAAALVAVIDHGMGTASSMAARFAASGGNPVNAAVAAGVLALGDYHGGAIEKAMQQLVDIQDTKEFVKTALAGKQTIYGFGHKVYKESDPRVAQVLAACDQAGFKSKNIELAQTIEKEIEAQKGKKIPLNVDGLIAAILLEMGFDAQSGKGFFVIARTPGLVAQVVEELSSDQPVRRIDEENIDYNGKQ